eukprot:jgi/Mesvir1/1782/Mv21815-RA.1
MALVRVTADQAVWNRFNDALDDEARPQHASKDDWEEVAKKVIHSNSKKYLNERYSKKEQDATLLAAVVKRCVTICPFISTHLFRQYSDAKEAYADLVDKSGFKPPEPETASEYVERVISRRLSVRKNEHSKAEQARAARQEADATKGLKRRPLGSIVMNQDASQQGAKQPLLKRKQPSPPAIMPRPQGLTPSTPTSSALSAAQEAQIAALYAQIDSIRSGGLASATFGAVSPPPPVPGFEVEPVADKAGSVVLAAVHCAGSRKRQ